MKKISIILFASAALFASCSDFLATDNIYGKDLTDFYSTTDEITEALASIYTSMYAMSSGGDESFIGNILDDITLGGGAAGGLDDATSIDAFSNYGVDYFSEMWTDAYNGVYRCNALIESIEGEAHDFSEYFDTDAEEEAYKEGVLAESYFMRGYCMFRAARFFGALPIIPESDSDRSVARSSYEETFHKLISDFYISVNKFVATPIASVSTSEYGHANRWAAIGYLARAYMFYTGYMTNIEGIETTTITLNSDAGGVTLTKDMVVALLEECRDDSGFYLVDKYANLWAYAYLNYAAVAYGDSNGDNLLPYAKNNDLTWTGQDGYYATLSGTSGNPETIFAIRYGVGEYNTPTEVGLSNTNRFCMMAGPRDNEMTPFYKGWGYATVNPNFYNDWDDADERKAATVYVMGDEDHRTESYTFPTSHQYTGYQQKKYTGLVISGTAYGLHPLFSYVYGIQVDNIVQQAHAIDFNLLRFSDILLMHSELTETADGMNQVRVRAGLSETSYSLEALKEERMYEFAYEAIRWFDLVRWGDIMTSNNSSTYFDKDTDTYNNKVETVYNMSYPTVKKGLVPIPETEVSLSNGAYTQNPGW
ncbi:MAG: RagB/SusD family nutrient uptake outer membrane protein [Rikenellaceae bacterium]